MGRLSRMPHPRVSTTTLLLLTSLLLALVTSTTTLFDFQGFYLTTSRRWMDGSPHNSLLICSHSIYPSFAYLIVAKACLIEDTLYIGVLGVQPCMGICPAMTGPASRGISDLNGMPDGFYNAVLVWDGGTSYYRIMKRGEEFEVIPAAPSLTTYLIANLMFLRPLNPWLNLLLCLGLGVLYLLMPQFIGIWKRRFGSSSLKALSIGLIIYGSLYLIESLFPVRLDLLWQLLLSAGPFITGMAIISIGLRFKKIAIGEGEVSSRDIVQAIFGLGPKTLGI